MELRSLHTPLLPRPLGFRVRPSPVAAPSCAPPPRGVRCAARGRGGGGGGAGGKTKEKGNVWSVDNDAAEEEEARKKAGGGRGRGRGGRRGRVPKGQAARKGSRVLVSGAMLVEVENVLQAQEPVIKPKWDTFASSVSGIWKGVGAVFSPLTAEIEPIGIGNDDKHLYDCYTLTRIEKTHESSIGQFHQIHRKRSWISFNPFGELHDVNQMNAKNKNNGHLLSKKHQGLPGDLPSHESFDFTKTEEIDEDFLSMEPGMVFFEDGSYSRGPVEIPVGEYDESHYFICPTFKFEQCLVKGCHKRLHVMHTIGFAEGGSNIQITRVAVYEETWDSPVHTNDISERQFDSKPFSQRARTKPTELAGFWKVFEVSCTPIFSDGAPVQDDGPPFVYLCTETLKKRNLPEYQASFREEEVLDMQDVTVLWLPGGVTGYVDIKDDGVLCIGIGWYSEEGINLVMERDYGTDGKLKEVRWKSEVKRRWEEPVQD